MIEPTGNKIIIKRMFTERITDAGVVLCDVSIGRRFEGQVVAVGKGKYSKKGVLLGSEIQVGDFVLYPKNTGWPVTHEGIEYMIIKEDAVLAVLPEPLGIDGNNFRDSFDLAEPVGRECVRVAREDKNKRKRWADGECEQAAKEISTFLGAKARGREWSK